MAATKFKVPDMECGHCAEKIEMAIRELDGVSDVITSVMSQKVTVMHAANTVSPQGISDAVREAGYTPDETSGEAATKSFWQNREKMFTVISGVFFFAGLITSYLFPESEHGPLWTGHLKWTEGLYLFAALIGGWNFLPAGFRALRSLSLDMDFFDDGCDFWGSAYWRAHGSRSHRIFVFNS